MRVPSPRMARFTAPARLALLLTAALCLAALPAEASSRKARGFYNKGRQAELAQNYDEALEFYELAGREAPKEHRYDLAVRRMRFIAGQMHVDAGHNLRGQGLLEEALAEFQRAMEIDPASSVAAQEHRLTLELMEKREKARNEEGGFDIAKAASPLEADRLERAQRIGSLMKPAQLAPLSTDPIDIMLNEKPRVVFETIGKLAGINVIFDSDLNDEEIEIEVKNATLHEALDYAALRTGAFWKTITRNTIFVTNDNPTNRRDYQEEIVKTIYLTNVATPQEIQELTTAIRGLTDIRKMFPVTSMNAIVLRGPRAKVAIAEKIVHDIDKPRPEVIIDVLVLETAKSNNRTLGFTPVGSKPGLQISGSFIGGAGEATRSLPLNRLGDLGAGSWSTTIPGFRLSAFFDSSDTNLLQSPRVRAADNYKADLRIGDRIPIATGSFQPGVGGVGINPLVNTQFTYTDVGVNIAITPKIHSNRDVSMHIEIEISNVKEFREIGGISQPVIGQRTVQHDVRIREGEANVIGGLNQSQIFKTRTGVPFIGELPVVGRLFSEQEVRRSESEILLVLIPHIVRMPGIDSTNLQTVASGTETVYRVRYEPEGNGKPALPPPANLDEAEEPAAEQTAAQPAVGAEADRTEPPAAAEPPQPADLPAPEAETPPPAPAPAADAESGAGPRLSIAPVQPSVAVGAEIAVTINVNDAAQLFSMPMRVQYDRNLLELTGIEKGAFLEGDDASDIIFSRNIRQSNGLAAVNISRFPGTGGADGSGALITLTFKGLAAGRANVRFMPTGPRNASAETLNVSALAVDFTVE